MAIHQQIQRFINKARILRSARLIDYRFECRTSVNFISRYFKAFNSRCYTLAFMEQVSVS
jgi:hypothetical protein